MLEFAHPSPHTMLEVVLVAVAQKSNKIRGSAAVMEHINIVSGGGGERK